MSSAFRHVVLPSLLIIAVFAVACSIPTRLSTDAQLLLLPPAFLLALFVLHIIARRRPVTFRDDMPDPSCVRCGYSLRGHSLPAIRCPECGNLLASRDIIVGKDIWFTSHKRRLCTWNLVFLVLVLATPLYMPGRQSRSTLLRFQAPVSKAYDQLWISWLEKRWAFRFGLTIPSSHRFHRPIQFRLPAFKVPNRLDLDADGRWYSYQLDDGNHIIVQGPLTRAGLLDWMASQGIDTASEKVKREVDVIWTCYESARNRTRVEPAWELFPIASIDLSDWSSIGYPEWQVRFVLVTDLLLWLLVALHVRRRAMIEASLAGPHRYSLMRKQIGESNESSTP